MPRINVSKVLKSSRFNEKFIIHRDLGNWTNGRWVTNIIPMNADGAVVAAGNEDIISVPEGDRSSEMIVFLSVNPLYVTRDSGISDKIQWKGKMYKLYQGKNWSSYGYYRMTGVSQ